MNRLASIFVVLGFFWNAASASFQVYSLPSADGGYIQQTVTIDNEGKIAIIHVNEGSCSSDTIFDYKHGYIAMRIFSRRACFVMKMERGYVPEIEEIGRLAYERQAMRRILSGRNLWVKYEPARSFLGEIKEWLIYGKHIEHLCSHVPVYQVEKDENAVEISSCVKAGILNILNISICAKTNGLGF